MLWALGSFVALAVVLALLALSQAEGALKRLPPLPEWVSEKTLSDLKLPSVAQALGMMHRPEAPTDIDPAGPAAARLAYDELFANQLALLLVRARMRAIPGRAHRAEGALARRLEAALPFSLTGAQRQAVDDIRADLRAEKRMLRLLQGDVGSGKTVVALYSLLRAVEQGYQGAFMAPTETLAEQHFATIQSLMPGSLVPAALLTGSTPGRRRSDVLGKLASGGRSIGSATAAWGISAPVEVNVAGEGPRSRPSRSKRTATAWSTAEAIGPRYRSG